MSSQRILLVDDEAHLLEAISLNLKAEGYLVHTATDGKTALKLIKEARFDLAILDVMLPQMGGFQLCETIRLENKSLPILFLTARGTTTDRIQGLTIGADDYLSKPFNLEEFLLRVAILLRRDAGRDSLAPQMPNLYTIAGKQINFNSFEVFNGRQLCYKLTKKEVLLLQLLILHQNEVVSREQILAQVWSYDIYPSTRSIDNFILSFRKYFEPNPKKPVYFHSVRGVGYKFTNYSA